MAQSFEHFLGQVLHDSYRIERVIGAGGMGAVFEASHTRLPKRFAIKLLLHSVKNPEAIARFEQEARITSALNHPHIVEVTDFNLTDKGAPYIVMELLDGEDLRVRLRREGALPLARTASILRQAASALQAAHEAGVVHRDLKPSNLFLCQRGQRSDYLKLLDFGISKVLGSERLTGSFSSLGTPAYMAPEQALGKAAAASERTDIFSLGAMLYELLTGVRAFRGRSLADTLNAVLEHEPQPPSALCAAVPPELDDVVLRALAKRPAERQRSMEQLLEQFIEAAELQRYHADVPTEDRDLDWVATAELGGPVEEQTQKATPAAPLDGLEERKTEVWRPAVALETTEPPPGEARVDAGEQRATTSPSHPPARRLLWVATVLLLVLAATTWIIMGQRREPPAHRAGGAPAANQSPPASAPQATRPGGVSARAPTATASRPPEARRATPPPSAPTSPAIAPRTRPPAPASAAASKAGRRLVINSHPSRGVVALDGATLGLTPFDRRISGGAGVLTVTAKGYRRWSHRLGAGNAPTTLRARLTPLPAKLRVVTTQRGESVWANVVIDGRQRGLSPLGVELPAGSHQLVVGRAGFLPVTRRVTLHPGRLSTVVIELRATQ